MILKGDFPDDKEWKNEKMLFRSLNIYFEVIDIALSALNFKFDFFDLALAALIFFWGYGFSVIGAYFRVIDAHLWIWQFATDQVPSQSITLWIL
jgi:hypothetical protein